MSRLLRTYLTCLERYPLRTQATTSGTLMATGDMIAQFAVERRPFRKWEPARTGRFFIFGMCVVAPTLRGWYTVLERNVKFASTTATTFGKVVCDQTIFAPCFLGFFLFSMTLWKTYDPEQAVAKTKEDYFSVLTNNWKLWPMVQLVNFYFVPFQHRILLVNSVSLIWNTYLAYKTNSDDK